MQFAISSSSLRHSFKGNLHLRTSWAWSSLIEGDEGLHLPNCQANLVYALHALSLLFWHFINTTAYHWADMSLHLPLAVALPNQCDQIGRFIGLWATF